MRRCRRCVALASSSLFLACAQKTEPKETRAAGAPTPVSAVIPPTDSAATIAAFEQRAAAIERDTVRMRRTQKPVSFGAGSAGTLTAWRAGPVWRRLRVETVGVGFRSNDDYWLSDGACLGARLEMIRPNRQPVVDVVWFRGLALYRWTDAAGRRLTPNARSTQFEVRMMRARLDSLLRLLDADDAIQPATR